MICSNCKTKASRIVSSRGKERCEHCAGFSAAGGAKTDNILTRNSLRVRTEAVKYEGDTILPHAYDKSKGKVGINEEFVKLYPDRVKDYFSEEQLNEAGLNKLADHSKKLDQEQKDFKEKELDAITSIDEGVDKVKEIVG